MEANSKCIWRVKYVCMYVCSKWRATQNMSISKLAAFRLWFCTGFVCTCARHSGLSIGGWLPDLALVFLLLLRFAALATHATDIIRKKVYIWIRLISKMKMIPKHRGKMLLTCKNVLSKRVAMCACEQCGFDIWTRIMNEYPRFPWLLNVAWMKFVVVALSIVIATSSLKTTEQLWMVEEFYDSQQNTDEP